MKPALLKIGSLEALLEYGGLRYISWDGIEIVRGVYIAVRDKDWETVTPRFEEHRVLEDERGITVMLRCAHEKASIDFIWKGTIRIEERSIRFAFEGEARSAFLKNRIGFCILHPMEFAGLPVTAQTPSGAVKGQFPRAISADQPFKEMEGMSCEPVPGVTVTMKYSGDLFEMEDQRNWTDASYKTYCTPLELPFPAAVQPGERIAQSVEIGITGKPHHQSDLPDKYVQATIHRERVGKLPEIGFCMPGDQPGEMEAEWLRRLKPCFLRVVLDQTADHWLTHLKEAADWCESFGCTMEMELLVHRFERLQELIQLIAEQRIPVKRLFPFAHGTFVSDEKTILTVKRILRELSQDIAVGGGTRAYYAELNRAKLPLAELDFVAYSINPQVHAFDDRSVMETITAQSVTAADAYNKSGKELYIGPVTLKPIFNPNAAGDTALKMSDRRDDRQSALFGAAWTLGSVSSLSREGVGGVSYYEAFGPVGLVGENGVNPLYFVMQDIMEFRNADVLRLSLSSKRAAGLLLRLGERVRLLLANTTDGEIVVSVETNNVIHARIRLLDDNNWKSVASEPGAEMPYRIATERKLRLKLSPYAYACIDFEERDDGGGGPV